MDVSQPLFTIGIKDKVADNKEKVIVMPEKWYLSSKLNKKSIEIDIVPPDWKTIGW